MPDCHICGKSDLAMLCVCGECVEPGWIPVTERLPENNDDYLVYYRKTYMGEFEAMWIGIYSFISCHGGWQTEPREIVTHWMPLPKPPEGGGG